MLLWLMYCVLIVLSYWSIMRCERGYWNYVYMCMNRSYLVFKHHPLHQQHTQRIAMRTKFKFFKFKKPANFDRDLLILLSTESSWNIFWYDQLLYPPSLRWYHQLISSACLHVMMLATASAQLLIYLERRKEWGEKEGRSRKSRESREVRRGMG